MKVHKGKVITISGMGGGSIKTDEYCILRVSWEGTELEERKQRVATVGEACVGDLDNQSCDVLLGLPYMRDNTMNLLWTDVPRREASLRSYEDEMYIKGVRVEVLSGH